MAIGSGLVSVTNSATLICSSNGPVVLQNLGALPVTVGGPSVSFGHGFLLPPGTPATPSVPATGVAAQNASASVMQAVVSANGATITAVVVNGVTVGTAAGTYYVPAYGTISIAYTGGPPTWVWSVSSAFPAMQVPCVGGSGTPLGDPIYGVTSTSTSNVAYMTATWDG
jgi:hypothetical protein